MSNLFSIDNTSKNIIVEVQIINFFFIDKNLYSIIVTIQKNNLLLYR